MDIIMTPGEAMGLSIGSIPQDWRPAVYDWLIEPAVNVSGATQAAVITALLGNGASYGANPPPTSMSFPADHALHLDMGDEWYWLSANLTVDGSDGQDQIAVLVVIARNRTVTNAVQAQAGWTDTQAQVVDSTATVTLSTRQVSKIVRRNPNVQWAALGGDVVFGTNPFTYRCGPDSLIGPSDGSQDVLPLAVYVDDGDNLNIQLTMTSDLSGEAAFFLQGENGITPAPKAGLYYSWPQLAVSGTIVVEGTSYAVSGTGWIDHQLMMYQPASPPPPFPPLPPPPSPGWAPMQQLNGWSWCQFNLANGDVFTGAGFQVGAVRTEVPFSYGFYLKRTPAGWEKIFIQGRLYLDRFLAGLENVQLPTAWRYEATDVYGGGLVDVVIVPGPTYPDGSFTTGNLKVEGETPVTVSVLNRAPNTSQTGACTVTTGSGYCESVDYEPPEQYIARAFQFLGIEPVLTDPACAKLASEQ
ncbi:MAG: lipocalin-like domain-containing protein [Sphingomonas sp.]|jgi:hypothetical protein|uniref:lipocalin-like domain-containing protein n=1 Tax=Sphingomonas sp. TaxID=28214 RepID=UPI00356471DA